MNDMMRDVAFESCVGFEGALYGWNLAVPFQSADPLIAPRTFRRSGHRGELALPVELLCISVTAGEHQMMGARMRTQH